MTAEPHELDMPFGPPDAWLKDGERIVLADRRLDVLATPGHPAVMWCSEIPWAAAVLRGPCAAGHITPSLGFERSPEKASPAVLSRLSAPGARDAGRPAAAPPTGR